MMFVIKFGCAKPIYSTKLKCGFVYSIKCIHFSVCGEVEALRALLATGADITITDLNGGSPVIKK